MNAQRAVLFSWVLAVAIAGSLALVPPAAATNGYLIHGIGTHAKGLAGAGVALPQGALTAAVNPAGMVLVGKRYDAGLAIFNPNREYTVSGAPSLFPGTFGLVPGTVESGSDTFAVPNFGVNWMLGTDASFGLSVYGQGGMNSDYPTGTFFGTSPTGVNLSQLFITPTYARKLAGGHAVGVSAIIAYQQFEAEGLQAFGPFSSDPAKLTNNGADASTGFGFKIGYLGQWTPNFSFGASYQSVIAMDEFSDYAGLFAEQGDFDIPSNISVGFAFKMTPSTTLAVDAQEIYYSDVDSVHLPLLPNLLQAPLGANGAAGFGWQDITVYKLGVEHATGGAWTWRFGYSTTDQPIPPSEVLFNILAPGVVEDHITVGFTRKVGTSRAFSLALMHAPSVSVTGPNPLDAPGFQDITLEMDQWDLEFGFSWGL